MNKLNEDVAPIKSIHDIDTLTSTPLHCPTPKYNLSPTSTEPFVHPLHRSNTKSIRTPKTIKKFPSIKHSMILRQHGWKPHLRSLRHRVVTTLAAQHVQGPISHSNHIHTPKGVRLRTDKLLMQNELIWGKSLSNELGRLTQGVRDVGSNGAMIFIHKNKVPKNKKVTYANMVCNFQPTKQEQYRVRLTIGGDVLDFFADSSPPAVSLIETKLILNSTISDSHKGAQFFTIDIKDFPLQSYLNDPEYLRIHQKYFFDDIRKKYNIDDLVAEDGYVYCELKRGLYGLKQAARLARDQLVKYLGKYGYSPCRYAPNIWKQETLRTKFCLCVDDFGVKCFSETDANHLINALKKAYDITIDRSGTRFCGLHLTWDYKNRHVDVQMPQYVSNTLEKLQHKPPKKPQHAPHKWVVR